MMELAFELPLAHFTLRVDVRLSARATAVLGRSGSGKTSLLEVLAGLRRGARGRLVRAGEVLLDSDASINVPPERRRMGYVPQEARLFPHLNVEENIRFTRRKKDGRGPSLEELVELLELGPLLRRSPATLSGGERQRVALARALAADPALLLLDEPLAALDVELKERVLPYLLRVRDALGVPMLYVTHQAGEARALAEEVLVLEGGRVAMHGPADAVLAPVALGPTLGEEHYENILEGALEGAGTEGATLRLTSGLLLHVLAGAGTGRGVFALRAEDVLLSLRPLEGVSARNVLPGVVESLGGAAHSVLVGVRTGGVLLLAQVTEGAVQALALVPGMPVYLAIKASAFKRLR